MLSYKNVWISRHETRDILLIKSGSKQKTNATQKGIQDNSQMVYQQLEIFLFISGDAKKSRRNISLIMRPLFIKKWKDKINGRDVLDNLSIFLAIKEVKDPMSVTKSHFDMNFRLLIFSRFSQQLTHICLKDFSRCYKICSWYVKWGTA